MTPAGVGYHRAIVNRWSLASLGPPATVRVASGDYLGGGGEVLVVFVDGVGSLVFVLGGG